MKTEQEKLNNLKNRQDKQNRYIKQKYDRVSVVLPKGYKELINSSGATLNGFVTEAVNAELKRRGLLPEDNITAVPDTEETEFPFN